MIKRIFSIFIVFIVSLTSVYAEDLNNYDSLEVQVKVNGELQVVRESSSYSLEYISSELSFFPKNDEFQEVKDEKIISIPNAKIKKGDTINYRWEDYNPELVFGVESVVNTRTNFNKVTQKIPFPIKEDLSLYNQYLVSTSLVNSDDPRIIKKANELVEGEDDLFVVVYKMALWTKENIDYDLETLTSEASQSSVWVLENKKGVCDELTTLFVAMLRSKGIPARFVTGSSYTNVISDFGNHAWAEIYFPNVGWVAFDPTYGQLGYVDAAHIKMKESVDIKNSSVNYAWRSKNINLNPKEMEIKVNVLSKGEAVSYDSEISLGLLKNKVGPGSKVPLKVVVKNNENFYLPVTLYLTKGPSEVKDNTIGFLLRPNSKESALFLVDIPQELNEGFIYDSELEVKDSYEHKQSVKLEYGKNYDVYTSEEAQYKIERIEEEHIGNIELTCSPSREIYYAYEEQGIIHCTVKNNDKTSFSNLELCFESDCKNIDILPSEEKTADFTFDLKKEMKEGIVTLKGENLLQRSYFDLKILNNSSINIISLDYPSTINYKESAELKFSLEPNSEVKSIYAKVGDKEVFSQETLKFKSDFVVPFSGNFFYFNEPVIEINYKDVNGKYYTVREELSITVVDTPWYAWISKILR